MQTYEARPAMYQANKEKLSLYRKALAASHASKDLSSFVHDECACAWHALNADQQESIAKGWLDVCK